MKKRMKKTAGTVNRKKPVQKNETNHLGPVKFWIAPNEVAMLVEDTHIQVVMRNPRFFGYGSSEELRKRFDANNEKRGMEGVTRAEILIELMSRGYMRVRRDRQGNLLTINADAVGAVVPVRVRKFLKRIAAGYRFPVYNLEKIEKVVFFREADRGIRIRFVRFENGNVLHDAKLSAILRAIRSVGSKAVKPEILGDQRETLYPQEFLPLWKKIPFCQSKGKEVDRENLPSYFCPLCPPDHEDPEFVYHDVLHAYICEGCHYNLVYGFYRLLFHPVDIDYSLLERFLDGYNMETAYMNDDDDEPTMKEICEDIREEDLNHGKI
jgi:hypothetical protein